VQKEVGLYFTKRIERLSPQERWFAALLFGFKLFAAAMIIVPIVWYMTLPQHHSSRWVDFDGMWYSAAEDFSYAANITGCLCLLASGVIVIGGLIQLLKYSRRGGAWSIVFGGIAMVAGIFLVFHLSTSSLDIFRLQTLA